MRAPVPHLTRVALAALLCAGCAATHPDADVAFYLAEAGADAGIADPDALALEDTPFLRLRDLRSYDWATHTMTVTEECHARLKQLFRTGERKPMIARPFVVQVAGERIYGGMLVSPLSSAMYLGSPTIPLPLVDWEQPTLHIEWRGEGTDPRLDGRLHDALAGAGVLVEGGRS